MKIEVGDILLFPNGKLAEVLQKRVGNQYGLTRLQFVDEDTDRLLDLENRTPKLVKNLGQSDSIMANYYLVRSIHVRLNRMNKI